IPGVVVSAGQLRISQPQGWQIAQLPNQGSDDLPALPAVPTELNKGRLPNRDPATEATNGLNERDEIAESGEQAPQRSDTTMATVASA
ncbi:MAG: AsmA family protein, partial [Comamonas sp.]